MQNKFLVITGGYIPAHDQKYTENVSETDAATLLQELPQMLRSMSGGGLVRQIEDPEHPLNGWEIEAITIERMDPEEEETDEQEEEQEEEEQ
jgi:hypothetical protein